VQCRRIQQNRIVYFDARRRCDRIAAVNVDLDRDTPGDGCLVRTGTPPYSTSSWIGAAVNATASNVRRHQRRAAYR
jgi:hypothetical protein